MSLLSFGASVEHGADLFDGTTAFKKGAVACVACHNVKSDKVISGGELAMDLSAMGGAIEYTLGDINAMSSEIMKAAYKNKMLTKEEIADVDAFLLDAAAHPGEGSGSYFIFLALILAGVLYFLLSKLNERKTLKQSVNQELYDRQTMKTSWRD